MVEESSEQSTGQGGDEASEDKKKDPAIERLQIYVGLVKFAIGTVALGTITLFLNEQYRNAQLALEREKSAHALELQDKRAEVEYLSKFVANAMDKDFKVRVDFADYMKSVALSKTLKEIWSKYYDLLSQKQAETEQVRAQLVVRKDDTARQLATIEFTKPNAPSTAELVKQLQGTYDQLYLVQEKLDRARYGTFQQNYFDFRQAAKDADAAQQAGNYARERDLMLDAAGRVPREIKPYFLARLASAYRALHDFANADKTMQEAVDLAPTADSLFRLAIMQKNDNKLDLALKSLGKAADLPADPQFKLQIELVTAGYLIHNGQREEGIGRFEALRPRLQPIDNFITNLAWFYSVADRKTDFYDALARSLQVDRQATLVWIDQEVDISKYRDEERFKQLVQRARFG